MCIAKSSPIHMGNTMLVHLVLKRGFSRIRNASDAFGFSLTWLGSIAGLFQILFLSICLVTRVTLKSFFSWSSESSAVLMKLTCRSHYPV